MISGLFLNLVCYFMATIGYALGDFKINSMFNIIRNIFYGVLMFFAAKYFGIVGTLVFSLSVTLLADLFFYTYRLHKLGYLEMSLLKTSLSLWVVIVPVSILAGWGCKTLTDHLLGANMYFAKLLTNGGMFTFFFIVLILLVDKDWRNKARQLTSRFVFAPVTKMMRPDPYTNT
jgi:hypothetical protein